MCIKLSYSYTGLQTTNTSFTLLSQQHSSLSISSSLTIPLSELPIFLSELPIFLSELPIFWTTGIWKKIHDACRSVIEYGNIFFVARIVQNIALVLYVPIPYHSALKIQYYTLSWKFEWIIRSLPFSGTSWSCSMVVGLTTTYAISSYITNVVSSNPARARCTRYNIMW
jgi:hypothetical protein